MHVLPISINKYIHCAVYILGHMSKKHFWIGNMFLFTFSVSVNCSHSLHCSVYVVQFTLFSLLCSVSIVQFTLFSLHCSVYVVQFTLFSLHCSVYVVQFHGSVSVVQFTLFSLRCTVNVFSLCCSVNVFRLLGLVNDFHRVLFRGGFVVVINGSKLKTTCLTKSA